MKTRLFTIFVLMIFPFGCSDQGVNSDSPTPDGAPITSSLDGKYNASSPNQCFALELDRCVTENTGQNVSGGSAS